MNIRPQGGKEMVIPTTNEASGFWTNKRYFLYLEYRNFLVLLRKWGMRYAVGFDYLSRRGRKEGQRR